MRRWVYSVWTNKYQISRPNVDVPHIQIKTDLTISIDAWSWARNKAKYHAAGSTTFSFTVAGAEIKVFPRVTSQAKHSRKKRVIHIFAKCMGSNSRIIWSKATSRKQKIHPTLCQPAFGLSSFPGPQPRKGAPERLQLVGLQNPRAHLYFLMSGHLLGWLQQ